MARTAPSERVQRLGRCVVLDGGPTGGWWYTEADWKTRVEATRLAVERGQRVVDNVSRYRPTKDVRVHPDDKTYPGLVATVWRWK